MDLSQVAQANREELTNFWRTKFKRPPPKGLSQNLLRLFLANECQKCSGDGSDRQIAKALERIKTTKTKKISAKFTRKLKAGSRLIRDWNGMTHHVDVTDDGFEWKGNTYRSLSAIAREITGAHWSGPRFFGLNHNRNGRSNG